MAVATAGCVLQADATGIHLRETTIDNRRGIAVIWFIILLLIVLAVVGGIALSKFLFVLLLVAIVLALLGRRGLA